MTHSKFISAVVAMLLAILLAMFVIALADDDDDDSNLPLNQGGGNSQIIFDQEIWAKGSQFVTTNPIPTNLPPTIVHNPSSRFSVDPRPAVATIALSCDRCFPPSNSKCDPLRSRPYPQETSNPPPAYPHALSIRY